MTTNSRTSRWLAAGSLAAAAIAVVMAANPSAATSHPADDAVCSFDPASLPQTGDAVDGWYDQCRTRRYVAIRTGLPGSPDAGQSWFVQRKTGERFATDTGP